MGKSHVSNFVFEFPVTTCEYLLIFQVSSLIIKTFYS